MTGKPTGAATLAAQAVREKPINAASQLLEAAATDLVTAGNKISGIGTNRSTGRSRRSAAKLLGRRGAKERGEFRQAAEVSAGSSGDYIHFC